MKKFLYLTAFIALFYSPISANNFSEFSVHGGIIYPQGTFNTYTNNGGNARLRVIGHIKSVESFSGWLDLSGSLFSHETEDVFLTDGMFLYDAVREKTEYAVSLHAGLQLGSDSRNSFFRPKAGIGGGLYLFNTETSIYEDGFEHEDPAASDNNTSVRVGWKGYLGLDLFFSPKWGISLEFCNDHVLNLHHTINEDSYVAGEEIKKVGQSARFNTYSIGVIFPLPVD